MLSSLIFDDARYKVLFIEIVGFLVEMHSDMGSHSAVQIRDKVQSYSGSWLLKLFYPKARNTNRKVFPL